ncbi:MAG: RecX family transcriptional regulator [Rhodospirillaceae bacterium]
MTETRLRNIAVWYCQRYLVSAGKLADHLDRRLRREMPAGEERDALAAAIPEIVADLARMSLVNDREAASARLRSALRSGYATDAAIGRAARAAMVDREVAAGELDVALGEALPELDPAEIDTAESAAGQAALALRRARRGPWRTAPQDERTRRRDAGWLQRRGFRLDAIRAALDIDPLEDR